MTEELKITIVGDSAGGGSSSGGSGSGGKGGGIAKSLAGGMATGGLGYAISKIDTSIEGMASNLATLPLKLIPGIGWILGGAVSVGMKKALQSSEAIQGLKKTSKEGMGAVVDSVVGLTYLFGMWVKDNWGPIAEEVGLLLSDPAQWITNKINETDLFSISGEHWWTDFGRPNMKKDMDEDPLTIMDMFTTVGLGMVWVRENILVPIGDVIIGAFDYGKDLFRDSKKIKLGDVFDYGHDWNVWRGDREAELRSTLSGIVNMKDIFSGPKININDFFDEKGVKIKFEAGGLLDFFEGFVDAFEDGISGLKNWVKIQAKKQGVDL